MWEKNKQKNNGTIRVIAYGSWSLSPAENNYHLHSGKIVLRTEMAYL